MCNILKSIKLKMMVLFTSTLCFVVFVLLFFNIFYAESFYIEVKEKELLEIYYSISKNYTNNSNEIYNRVSSYEDELNLRVFIYDHDLNIVYETLSNQITGALINQYTLTQQGKLIQNFMWYPQANVIKSYRNDSQTLAIRGSVNYNNTTQYIILEIPIATIQQAVITLNSYIIRISMCLLFIGTIIIYIFSYRLSKPISAISRVAKNVANLDFTAKVPVRNSSDEINMLAQNINFMATELENTIGELKIANEALKRDINLKQNIDNMRKEFIANVSHELKTPLSIMQGYAEMLKSDIKNIDKDFYYDVILDENRHMNELVTKLLNISKLENNLSKLNCENLDLINICSWIITKNKGINNDIEISLESDIEVAEVFAEKLHIEQVLSNFISNAYTYAFSKIIVNVTNQDLTYRVSVTNDGEPICEDDLSKIWHSFYRADKARTRNDDKNFGLGLYIVKSIISAHSGEVGACNTCDGVCFWFEIPKIIHNKNLDACNISKL